MEWDSSNVNQLDPTCLPLHTHVFLQGKGVLDTQMPALPESVHAVPHINECYDWGTFGWVGAGCRVQSAECVGGPGLGLHFIDRLCQHLLAVPALLPPP